jgi:hypothetical protein
MPQGSGTDRHDRSTGRYRETRRRRRWTGGILPYLLFFLGFGAVGRVITLPFRAVWRRLSVGIRLLVVELVVLVVYVTLIRAGIGVDALFGDGLDGLVHRVSSTPDLLVLVCLVALLVVASERGGDRRRA